MARGKGLTLVDSRFDQFDRAIRPEMKDGAFHSESSLFTEYIPSL